MSLTPIWRQMCSLALQLVLNGRNVFAAVLFLKKEKFGNNGGVVEDDGGCKDILVPEDVFGRMVDVMLQAAEIKPSIWWVGGIDWNERNFHGYTTERGSTYNAYLIMDEKITLVDTCKREFADEMLERIATVVDPCEISYIVANHVEMDHSGALPIVAAACPNAQVVCSDPQGVRGLKAHFGSNLRFLPVKSGDRLSLGKRELRFVHTPMVHWPDNMVAYSPVDRLLFSNDAFGQHFASSKRFDDEVGLPEVMAQAKKYYANIVMPYGKNVRAALRTLSECDFDMIAPSHGVIWRSHVNEVLAKYSVWSSGEAEEYALVIYDSMWHTTEAMARAITEAFMEMGIPARLYDLKVNHVSDIMTEVLSARYIAVGSPTLNKQMMPTVAAFLCYMKGLAPAGRVGIPFGSYGWMQAGPKDVAAALEACGFQLPCGVIAHQWVETPEGLDEVRDTVKAAIVPLHEGR